MRYERRTEGIRVRVRPGFSLAQSDPIGGEFVFTYDVELLNESPDDARLLFRHWRIHDAVGEDVEVDGEGVIGEQPSLAPGGSHQYRSFCVLKSPLGFMEGYYTFERPDGGRFRVTIPRFDLQAPITPRIDRGEDEDEVQMH